MIIKRFDEVTAEPVTDAGAQQVNVRWVIAQRDGAPNFYMRVFELEPGGCTPLHQHPWEHEMFVYEGEGCIVKEGKEVPISQGTVIFVPADEKHQMKNTAQRMFKVICLIPAQK